MFRQTGGSCRPCGTPMVRHTGSSGPHGLSWYRLANSIDLLMCKVGPGNLCRASSLVKTGTFLSWTLTTQKGDGIAFAQHPGATGQCPG